MGSNLDLNPKDLGRTRVTLKESQSVSPTNAAIFQTRDTLEAYLKTAPGGSFSQAYLDGLTHNDLVAQAREKIGAAVNTAP